ncbi:SIMPL domain-containing protein [uncultured Pontibacter sp.]|uniref:SIMPL domain-containing protein n=1 Tax=uncultured Pontibacter sp. TaxID=453356 RepID=UPI00262D6FF5|nr:SIMPL domain-containing protein [uncultured Pontibacter sp.]
MKKMNLVLFLSMLVFSALSVQAQQTQVLPPLVSVNGTGEVRVQPNEVVVNLGVETRGKTLDEARKETDKKAAAIINYLKKQGVEAKHIQTSFVTLRPVYTSGEYGRTSPDFYMAQKSMTVIVKKLDKFDELLSGLYEVGANHVDGVQFQVSDMEKYKTEARKKAVANAKDKASMLTSELGAKLGRVYAIGEGSSNGGPRPMYKMAVMESAVYDSAGGPTIAGGEVIISANVDVSFVIE